MIPPGRFDSASSHCPLVEKVPKAASSTVFELMYALGSRNGFAVDSRPMYLPRAPGGVARADAIVPHGAPPMNTTLEQYMRWSAKL